MRIPTLLPAGRLGLHQQEERCTSRSMGGGEEGQPKAQAALVERHRGSQPGVRAADGSPRRQCGTGVDQRAACAMGCGNH